MMMILEHVVRIVVIMAGRGVRGPPIEPTRSWITTSSRVGPDGGTMKREDETCRRGGVVLVVVVVVVVVMMMVGDAGGGGLAH
jgi:hypothetical protein